MATRIKKNDTVIIKTGKDKGKEGKVILVLKNTAIVEGINIATRHVKSGTGAKETGFVQKELPIHISNLIFKDSDSGKSGRVKIEKLSDGTSSRVVVESKKSENK
jgi:large subunit ribosomal protein L24|tara:strand:- start:259 stop:573 length:315 start_codon:yes stop_codon:yes gene_type:complete